MCIRDRFYIARYEMGIDTITTATTSNHNTAKDGSIKPVSKLGKGTWNYIPDVYKRQ